MRDLLRGLKNFWVFRKEIYNYRWWDHSYYCDLNAKALEQMEYGFKNHQITLNDKKQAKRICIMKNLFKRIGQESMCPDVQHKQNRKRYVLDWCRYQEQRPKDVAYLQKMFKFLTYFWD